jgi:hypothetical protein
MGCRASPIRSKNGGLVMAIDPNNPFNFAYPSNQNFWGTAQLSNSDAGGDPDTHGATHSWSSISAGTFNTADNFFVGSGADASSSPFNNGNGLGGYGGPGNSYLGGTNSNGGSGQSGPDGFGDVTVVNTAVSLNPTFAGDNIYTGQGSIGLYGRSRGSGFSIGVLGQSSIGCGLLGLATDENAQSRGIGVVGRSVGGKAAEVTSVEDVMAAPIGVLGQSAEGSGVRGHGASLLQIPFAASLLVTTVPNGPVSFDLALGSRGSPTSATKVSAPPAADGVLDIVTGSTAADFAPSAAFISGETSFEYTLSNAAGTSNRATVTIQIAATQKPPVALPSSELIEMAPIGGMFSSGQLESQQIPLTDVAGKGGAVLQLTSRDPIAQLGLVPFVALSFPEKDPPRLPAAGAIGDLFLCVIPTQRATGDTPQKTAAQLWICTGYGQDLKSGAAIPRWQPVEMGAASLGGTPIPLTATP